MYNFCLKIPYKSYLKIKNWHILKIRFQNKTTGNYSCADPDGEVKNFRGYFYISFGKIVFIFHNRLKA